MSIPLTRDQIAALLLVGVMLACESSGGALSHPPLEPKPENLVVYLERSQRQYVRLSTGELAHECFTDADLAQFMRGKVAQGVAAEARASAEFKAIVGSLLALPVTDRTRWLDQARRHYHPTWGQLGRITRDGSGQTDAGQHAERVVAAALTAVAEELLKEKTRNGI